MAENSSSAQMVASSDDLLIEIIQRLPFNTFAQLRLVSNYWNSLMLDPKLGLSHNRPALGLIFEGLDIGHETPSSYIIFLDKSITPPIRNMIPPKVDTFYRHCKILHSCNGLLLCVSKRDGPKYYVFNPTTRKHIQLPDVVFDHSRVSIRGMYLAFDPSKSPHYKVVCVMRSFAERLHLFEVYSSETRSWRKGGDLFKADFDCEDGVHLNGANYEDGVYWNGANFEDGVYWNRAIHWVNISIKPQGSTCFTKPPREPVYFSLDCDQTPKVFPKPPLQNKPYYKNDYYFGESCDHLHFIDAHRTSNKLVVYEMKRDYSEWFVKYNVNVGFGEWYIRHEFTDTSRRYIVVRGKNDEDSFLVVATGQRIVRYNFELKTCEILYEFKPKFEDRPVSWGAKRPFQYIQSLCPV
ncbi:hypothetical protein CASFOL_012588 [Castilleja foliolosa]|uniref:F-box domain-containing protein n=1 Tax=Castilleja foliolosa TaxID=1961234 RepID=A0ABD3DHI3_9LAMI